MNEWMNVLHDLTAIVCIWIIAIVSRSAIHLPSRSWSWTERPIRWLVEWPTHYNSLKHVLHAKKMIDSELPQWRDELRRDHTVVHPQHDPDRPIHPSTDRPIDRSTDRLVGLDWIGLDWFDWLTECLESNLEFKLDTAILHQIGVAQKDCHEIQSVINTPPSHSKAAWMASDHTS